MARKYRAAAYLWRFFPLEQPCVLAPSQCTGPRVSDYFWAVGVGQGVVSSAEAGAHMGLFRISVAGLAVLMGVSCAGDGTGLELVSGVDQVTLSGDVQPIFTSTCALSGCHAGSNPEEGLNLSAGQTFANVVNVPSRQLPGIDRVTPSRPDSSYLVLKLSGMHLDAGGSGAQMPKGGTPLSMDQLGIIGRWILNGALNN